MKLSVDERTLVADVKSYIDSLEGFRAEVEEHSARTKRADLTIYHDDKLICIAEFKRPTTLEGATPRNVDVVDDAYNKANHAKNPPRFFVTSNFNETIIWDNYDTSKPVMARDVYTIFLERRVKNDDDFNLDETKEEIKTKMQELALYIYDLITGVKKAQYKPLGESFILGLNAHLESASTIIKKNVPNNILQKWWKEQNYLPKVIFDGYDRERIAKYSLYVLANKIVFFYVLKRMFPKIKGINYKKNNISDLKSELDSCFDSAKEVSGDYETVFENSDADKIPFMNEENTNVVRSLIRFLSDYDFGKLSQGILGNIYDRLINPEERHANGQYYTPIPVVDLINALTIKSKNARVMDPACGSGTFLARAFDLKLRLYGNDDASTRETVMKEIFGCDISPYPAHLATVALASKLLIYKPDVYPNILRKDFLELRTSNVIPRQRKLVENENENETKTLSGESKPVSFKPMDAFVGNLPYIRQEEIENKEKEREKVKNFLSEYGFTGATQNEEEHFYIPDAGSDLHVYFWYYLLPFLDEGSMVGFLTSDTWMNVEYGEGFKKFLNKYFKIKYIIDSSVERWFEDALVNTAITVLERTSSDEARMNNMIKFVRINRKISEIVKDIDDAIMIVQALDKGKNVNGVEIVRCVRQGDIDFNDTMKGKLFPYHRGPDEFFEIVNNENMTLLETLMDVQFGIKTGANRFFYVEDVTDEYSDEELKKLFGLSGGQKKGIRVIKDGLGAVHLMEADYLKPILKGPKEFTIPGNLVFSNPTKKYVVLIEETERRNIKKHALEYIEYGEKTPIGEPYSERSTCKARSPWWKLSPIVQPDLALSMYFSSNFLFPKTTYLLDNAMNFGKMREQFSKDLTTVFSFLNSTLSYLYPDLYGRNYGGGAAGFKVYEMQKIPVPDPEIMRPYYPKLESIMERMEKRRIGSVFEEVWDGKKKFSLNAVQKDRLELDRTILEALGFENPEEFLMSYYPSVVRIVKERLERAKSVKMVNKGGKVSLTKVADDIISHINVKDFPYDYVSSIKGTTKVRKGSKISLGSDLDGSYVSVDNVPEYRGTHDSLEMAKYVYYCMLRGLEEIPEPEDPKKVVKEFEGDLETWRKSIEKEIKRITEDGKSTERLLVLCARKLNYPMLYYKP